MYKYDVYWKPKRIDHEFLIGSLIYNNTSWGFFYSDNIYYAIENGFQPFLEMPDIEETYISSELFKTFKYRLINKEEPEKFITDNITLKKLVYVKDRRAKN